MMVAKCVRLPSPFCEALLASRNAEIRTVPQ